MTSPLLDLKHLPAKHHDPKTTNLNDSNQLKYFLLTFSPAPTRYTRSQVTAAHLDLDVSCWKILSQLRYWYTHGNLWKYTTSLGPHQSEKQMDTNDKNREGDLTLTKYSTPVGKDQACLRFFRLPSQNAESSLPEVEAARTDSTDSSSGLAVCRIFSITDKLVPLNCWTGICRVLRIESNSKNLQIGMTTQKNWCPLIEE